jgi:hypothetical protein
MKKLSLLLLALCLTATTAGAEEKPKPPPPAKQEPKKDTGEKKRPDAPKVDDNAKLKDVHVPPKKIYNEEKDRPSTTPGGAR